MIDLLPFTVCAFLGTVVVAGLVLWRLFNGQREREQAFTDMPDAEGMIAIPVRGTASRGGFMAGHSGNSINPGFAVGKTGLRIKVLRNTNLPFGTISQVDAGGLMTGGTALIFEVPGRVYIARFGDPGLARQALALMPPGVPLTEEAATVRDGHAGAATKGLKRYRGPLST